MRCSIQVFGYRAESSNRDRPVTRPARIPSYVIEMEMGPSLALAPDDETELEFQPFISVAARGREPHVAESGLSFIGGSFGRIDKPRAGTNNAAGSEGAGNMSTVRQRWGVGYIVGVGPTEVDGELRTPPIELAGAAGQGVVAHDKPGREFKSSVAASLLALILIVIGAGYAAVNYSMPVIHTTPAKTVSAPAQEATASVSGSVAAQPEAAAPPVTHHVAAAVKPAVVPPPAPAPIAAQPPTIPQPPATAAPRQRRRGWHTGGRVQSWMSTTTGA
jgi:hypothetical protein